MTDGDAIARVPRPNEHQDQLYDTAILGSTCAAFNLNCPKSLANLPCKLKINGKNGCCGRRITRSIEQLTKVRTRYIVSPRRFVTEWRSVPPPGEYAGDTTDEKWAVILPFTSSANLPRTAGLRALTDAIFYSAQTGCQRRLLSKEFPPYTTVRRYFYRWHDDSTWQNINHHLAMLAREADLQNHQESTH